MKMFLLETKPRIGQEGEIYCVMATSLKAAQSAVKRYINENGRETEVEDLEHYEYGKGEVAFTRRAK